MLSNDKVSLNVYPNPNFQGGQLTVDYTIGNDQKTLLYIYDAVGKEILQTDLIANANRVVLKLPQGISNGVYKVVIKQGNSILKTAKLSVIQ